jgi:hypothetical protein
MNLVEFLRARLDDEEATARAAAADHALDWRPGSFESWVFGVRSRKPIATGPQNLGLGVATAAHIARWDPARVLAEVAARRVILNAHGRDHECISLTGRGKSSVVDGQPWELWELEPNGDEYDEHWCFVLRALAVPFAAHPDFRDEWRIEEEAR